MLLLPLLQALTAFAQPNPILCPPDSTLGISFQNLTISTAPEDLYVHLGDFYSPSCSTPPLFFSLQPKPTNTTQGNISSPTAPSPLRPHTAHSQSPRSPSPRRYHGTTPPHPPSTSATTSPRGRSIQPRRSSSSHTTSPSPRSCASASTACGPTSCGKLSFV